MLLFSLFEAHTFTMMLFLLRVDIICLHFCGLNWLNLKVSPSNVLYFIFIILLCLKVSIIGFYSCTPVSSLFVPSILFQSFNLWTFSLLKFTTMRAIHLLDLPSSATVFGSCLLIESRIISIYLAAVYFAWLSSKTIRFHSLPSEQPINFCQDDAFIPK